MIICVVLIGTLRTLANADSYSVELDEKATISTLMSQLRSDFANDDLLNETNVLILRNGKEISVLQGVVTELKNNDTVTIIPISHGG